MLVSNVSVGLLSRFLFGHPSPKHFLNLLPMQCVFSQHGLSYDSLMHFEMPFQIFKKIYLKAEKSLKLKSTFLSAKINL